LVKLFSYSLTFDWKNVIGYKVLIFFSLSISREVKDSNYARHMDDLDIPLLNLSTIITATDNFSEKNKIGEGGFGPVYLVIQYWSMITK